MNLKLDIKLINVWSYSQFYDIHFVFLKGGGQGRIKEGLYRPINLGCIYSVYFPKNHKNYIKILYN